MSDYYNRNNGRKKRSRREKIGFYTAFSICLIAVSMAIYSTYNTMSVPQKATNPQTETTQAQQVNQVVTGVTETLAEPKLDFDPAKGRFVGNDAANALLDGPPVRRGWEEFERL